MKILREEPPLKSRKDVIKRDIVDHGCQQDTDKEMKSSRVVKVLRGKRDSRQCISDPREMMGQRGMPGLWVLGNS